MREFKFRAWDGVKMFYPDSLMFNIKGQPTTVFQHHNLPSGEGVLLSGGFTEDLRLMQYTGLKDKNEVEIYEGDLITFYDGATHHLYEVKYSTDEAMYTLANHGRSFSPEFEDKLNSKEWELLGVQYKMSYYALGAIPKGKDYEVTGNIYENKDLI